MALNFNPDSLFGPITGPTGPHYVPPTVGDETDVHDPMSSTISQSVAEALMVQFMMGWPVLQQPSDNASHTLTIAGITSMVGAEMARIGSEMWDKYLDHLAEEKERIAEYLNSPEFRRYVEERTMQGMVQTELTSNLNVENPTTVDFNHYITTRVASATELWNNTIDSVSSYIRENRESNPAASLFVAASFAVTSTYIGDYLNIVDVASTEMVTVNPVQDVVAQVLPQITPELQAQFALTINLFAIGLIHFSNAEGILRSGSENRVPLTWDTAVAFARSVLSNVENNVVSGFLLAMLISKSENLGATQEEREAEVNKLTNMAKAIMVAFAIGALLKASAPDMPLSAALFLSTVDNPLVAQSEADQRLVAELEPLREMFNSLRDNDMMPEDTWADLMDALGVFFDANPNFNDVFSTTNLVRSFVSGYHRPEIEG